MEQIKLLFTLRPIQECSSTRELSESLENVPEWPFIVAVAGRPQQRAAQHLLHSVSEPDGGGGVLP